MPFTLGDLSKLVSGTLKGDPDLVLTEIQSCKKAKKGSLSFILESKNLKQTETTEASALMTYTELLDVPNQIIVKNPREALYKVIHAFLKTDTPSGNRSEKAHIDQTAQLGERVTIDPFVVIGEASKVGEETHVHANVVIGKNCQIGKQCILYPNVTIYDNTVIGDRVIVHSGAVIGADGFGYYQDQEKVYNKLPHIGRVVIENDVEIGANTCIDRGCLSETRIGEGSKLDNLVQIAHNVDVGKRNVYAAQVGFAGSAKVGDDVQIGGQAGINDVIIGSEVTIAAKSGVTKNIANRKVVAGFPAQDYEKWVEMIALLRQRQKKKRGTK